MRPVVTSVLVAACLGPVAAAADDPDRFLVDDTSDLVALCEGAGGTDSERQALVFCHGFVVGAFCQILATSVLRNTSARTAIEPPQGWLKRVLPSS